MALTFVAGTSEGVRLGQLAAETVRVELTPTPFWLAPLEPLRWLDFLLNSTPHVFYTLLIFLALAALASLATVRRQSCAPAAKIPGLRRMLALQTGMAVLLLLAANHLALAWVHTVVPNGLRFVVPPRAPFVLANLHTHTQASGGMLMPEDGVRRLMDRGYAVLAITDSNSVRGGERARFIAETRHWPVTILVGEEYRGDTHLLFLNLHHDISAKTFPMGLAIRHAHAAGSTVIAAHAWTGRASYEELLRLGVDGFEVVSSTTLAEPAMRDLCERHHKAEVGNLDYRDGHWPLAATVLPAWANTPEKVQTALRQGDCAALYFSDRVQGVDFSPWQAMRASLPWLIWESQKTLVPGFLLWFGVGILVVRRRSHCRTPSLEARRSSASAVYPASPMRPACPTSPLPAFLGVLLLFVCSITLTAWGMWWQLKSGWIPRCEWVVWGTTAAAILALRSTWLSLRAFGPRPAR